MNTDSIKPKVPTCNCDPPLEDSTIMTRIGVRVNIRISSRQFSRGPRVPIIESVTVGTGRVEVKKRHGVTESGFRIVTCRAYENQYHLLPHLTSPKSIHLSPFCCPITPHRLTTSTCSPEPCKDFVGLYV